MKCGVIVISLFRNHDPTLHDPSGNIKFFCIRFGKGIFISIRTYTDNQIVLINSAGHVAVYKIAYAAEHFLFFNPGNVFQCFFNSLGKSFVVWHLGSTFYGFNVNVIK